MKRFATLLLLLCLSMLPLALCVGAEADAAAYTESYYVALADCSVDIDSTEDDVYLVTVWNLFDLRTMQRAETIQVVTETVRDAVILNYIHPGDVLHLSADGKLSVSSLSPAEAANAIADDENSRVFDLSGMDFVDGDSITLPGVVSSAAATKINIRVVMPETTGIDFNCYEVDRAIVAEEVVDREQYRHIGLMEEFQDGQAYYCYAYITDGYMEICDPTFGVFDNFINDMQGKTIIIPAADEEYGDYAGLADFMERADYEMVSYDIGAYGTYNGVRGTLDMTVLIRRRLHQHSFPSDWTVTTEPTMFQSGWAERKCTICGYTVSKFLPKTPAEYAIVTLDPWVLMDLLGVTKTEYNASLMSELYINDDGYVSIAVLDKATGNWQLASLRNFQYGTPYPSEGRFSTQKDVATLAKYNDIIADRYMDAPALAAIKAALSDNAVFLVMKEENGVYDLAGTIDAVGGESAVELYDYIPYGEEQNGLIFSGTPAQTNPITADRSTAAASVVPDDGTVIVLIDGASVAVRTGVQKPRNSVYVTAGTAKILSASADLIVMDVTGCALTDRAGNPLCFEDWSFVLGTYYVALADYEASFDIAADGSYIVTVSGLFDLRTMEKAEPLTISAESLHDCQQLAAAYSGEVLYLSSDGELSVSPISPAEAANALVDDDDSRVFDLSGMNFVDGESITIPGVVSAETATHIHIRVVTLGTTVLSPDRYDGDRAIVTVAADGQYSDVPVMGDFGESQAYYYFQIPTEGSAEIGEPTFGVFDNFINDMQRKIVLIPAVDEKYEDYADLEGFTHYGDYAEGEFSVSAFGVYDSEKGTLDMTALVLGPVMHEHSFPAAWTVTTAPTLFQTGLAYRKCTTCGSVVWQTLPRKAVDVGTDENYERGIITVVDADTRTPLADAVISLDTVSDGSCRMTTGVAGQAVRVLPVGEHTAVIEKEGYVTQTITLTVVRGQQDLGEILLKTDTLKQGNKIDGIVTAFIEAESADEFDTVEFRSSYGNILLLASDLGITAQTPKVTYLGLPMTLYTDCTAEEFETRYDIDPDYTRAYILSCESPAYTTVENLGNAGTIRYDVSSGALTLGDVKYFPKNYEFQVYTFDSDGWLREQTDYLRNFAYDAQDGYVGDNSYGRIDYRVVRDVVVDDNGTADIKDDIVKDVVEILYTPYVFGRFAGRTLRYAPTGKNETFAVIGNYDSTAYINHDGEVTNFVEYLLGAKYMGAARISESTTSVSKSAGEKAKSVTFEGVPAASGDFVFYSYNALDNILTVAQNCGSFREGRLTGCNYINYTVKIDGANKAFGFKGAFNAGTMPCLMEDYDFNSFIAALQPGKSNVQYIEADGNVVYVEPTPEEAVEYRFDYAIVTVNPAVLAELLGMTEEKYSDSLTAGLYINDDGYVSIAVLDKTTGKWQLASLKNFHYGMFDMDEGIFASKKNVATLAKYNELLGGNYTDAPVLAEIQAALSSNAVFLVINEENGVYDLAGNVGDVYIYDGNYCTFGKETNGLVFSDTIPKTNKIAADMEAEPARVTLNCDTVVVVIGGAQVGVRVGMQKSKDTVTISEGTARILSADSALIVMDATGCTLTDANGSPFDMAHWSAEPFILHEFAVTAEAIPATCETEGKTAVETCANCGAVRGGETIPARGHNYSTVWTVDKAATCTSTGIQSHHCMDCDAMTDVTEIPARGHSFSEWVVTKEAAADSEGERTHTCTVCGAEESETIPRIALGDADGDGVLTIRDTLMALRTMLNGSVYNATMDMNGDGKISLLDVLMLLKSIRA